MVPSLIESRNRSKLLFDDDLARMRCNSPNHVKRPDKSGIGGFVMGAVEIALIAFISALVVLAVSSVITALRLRRRSH